MVSGPAQNEQLQSGPIVHLDFWLGAKNEAGLSVGVGVSGGCVGGRERTGRGRLWVPLSLWQLKGRRRAATSSSAVPTRFQFDVEAPANGADGNTMGPL